MSDEGQTAKLDPCGCCETGLEEPSVDNPPGQPALKYRIGTHSSFLGRMLARLPRQQVPDGENEGQRPLAKLTTRSSDDPAIALLDAWATVADVLTFYQERIANENYLRSAAQRRSVLELARSIGYELGPGVAAEAYLSFSVDESDQTPDEAKIAAGTQVQSIPTKEGELPQTFETAEDFEANASWNVLRPRSSETQQINLSSDRIYLRETNLNLSNGDRILLVQRDSAGDVQDVARKQVRKVTLDADQDHTLVEFESEGDRARVAAAAPVEPAPPSAVDLALRQSAPTASLRFDAAFTAPNINSLLKASLPERQFQAALQTFGWKATDVLNFIGLRPAASGQLQVFALRESAGIFGHNAPHYNTLSTDAKTAFHPWDPSGWEIWKDSVKPSDSSEKYYTEADLYLERPVSGVLKESWILLEHPSGHDAFKVREAFQGSLSGFAISSKVTGLDLSDSGGNPLDDNPTDKDPGFKVRKTTAYLKSEGLLLAQVPITTDLPAGSTQLTLDRLVLGLKEGQPIALQGEQADAQGVARSEVKILDGITHSGGSTSLEFTEGLRHSYKRSTVVINANAVRATHGETVAGEALGSGDGAQANQRFKLQKPPLTHVSASTPSGTESTLTVRINGVEWQQASSLYGLDEKARSYIVRIDDNSDAFVTFGDGKSGARLPSGQENVVADYRSGIGFEGEVEAGSLTLLKKRPFGVRSVTNPLPASGAADPESLDEARQNAPLTVLTLDRIVSLRDFEDFARAFAGIGKAQAVTLWNGETDLVHITVADANGKQVDIASDLYQNLREAINGARDPRREVEIGSFQPRPFHLEARVLIDPAHVWERVRERIQSNLEEAFSFDARAFGQPVTVAEAVNLIHDIEGVQAVDVEKLHLFDESGQPVLPLLSSVLPARSARPNPSPSPQSPARFLPAELLLISSLALTEVRS